MKLFNRKKAKEAPVNNILYKGYIIIESKKIKPIFNEEVLEKIGFKILKLPRLKNIEQKWFCMAHSNISVFLGLKHGALKQGIEFKYSMSELFRLIDLQDYHNVMIEAQKSQGYVPQGSFQNN